MRSRVGWSVVGGRDHATAKIDRDMSSAVPEERVAGWRVAVAGVAVLGRGGRVGVDGVVDA